MCSSSDTSPSLQREDRPSFIPEQLRVCPCWLSVPQTRFKLFQNLDLFSSVSNHREKHDMLTGILEVAVGNANVSGY